MAVAVKTISLAQALHAFQAEAPALQKNAINPHFKNKYISLDVLMETVLPLLNKHGLVLTQEPTFVTSRPSHFVALGEEVIGTLTPALKTTLRLKDGGDVSLESTMPLMLDKENPQGQGSAITYARRYSLMAILGLVADTDDDGEKATSTRKSTKSSQRDNTDPSEYI